MGEKQGARDASDVHSAETLAGGAASKRSVVPELTGVSGDYEIGGEIARGGMGRILEAYDRRRDRRVALKLLLSDSETTRKRFEREAWITGRLQHPAIVPLYEAGVLPSGEPFYAMKLVRGGSLREVIKTKETLEERLTLLPHLIAMAEALAYAHQEGIVHRDLKSSNVLVGAFGETVVIDWGLAKVVAEPEESGDRVAGFATASLGSGSGSGSTLTDQGRVLGTPQFMPPEQAAGLAIDARADVYSLGACMYHALSGVPPYEARDPAQAIRELLAEPPPPLVEVAPGIPADLAAIVAKAMGRKKEDRYPTAKELAEDLQRFAAGRLVKAHVYTARELARRWVVKWRAAVMVAVGAVVVLAVLAGIGVRRIARERDTARFARVEAQGAATRAETQRDVAEKLIASLVGDLRDKLVPIGKLDVLSALGDRVLEYYRDAPTFTTDASTLIRRAEAISTLAGVDEEKQDEDAAVRNYREAIQLCDRAHELAPADPQPDWYRAQYLYRISALEQARGHIADSLAANDECRRILGRITPEPNQVLRWETRRALALATQAETLRIHGELARSRELSDAAITLLEGRSVLEREEPHVRDTLGWAYRYRALSAADTGNFAAAATDFRASLRIREGRVADQPDNLFSQYMKLMDVGGLSELNVVRGESTVALDALKENEVLQRKLVTADPSNVVWIGQEFDLLTLECQAERDLGFFRDALRDCAAAWDEELVRIAKTPRSRAMPTAASARTRQGEILLRLGSATDAVAMFNDALTRAAPWDVTLPDWDTNFFSPRPDALAGLARAELALSHPDDALAHALSARAAWEEAIHTSPSNALVADSANAALLVVGDAHLALHDTPAALASFTQAHDACASLFTRDPDDVYVKLHCAEADAKLASLTTDPAAAAPLRDEARALLAKVGPAYVRGLGKQAWVDGLHR